MATFRPPAPAWLSLLLPVAGFVHAGLYFLSQEEPVLGFLMLAWAGGILIALLGLALAARPIGVLAHFLGLLGASLAIGATLVIGLADPDLVAAVNAVFLLGLLVATWYALQWWLGAQPRFANREGLGLFLAAFGVLLYVPVLAFEKIYIFIADDVLAALGLAGCAWFLRRSLAAKGPVAPAAKEKA